jgi:meso-butanediol dehydrogenase / (S,S)-butanediol dehydrogenase / diacetyl reductase
MNEACGLEGRSCLIVGATTGIGRATAELLARHGTRLLLSARDAARCAEAVEALAPLTEVHGCPGDMSSAADMARVVAEAERRLGAIDLAFINAGKILGAGLLQEVDLDGARAAFELNALGVLNVLRAVLPRMTAAQRGAIVINSALSALRPRPLLGAYAAAKAAAINLAETAALEAGPHGVRVNVVAPGYIGSAAWLAKLGEQAASLAQTVPLRRIGTPAEVAQVVAWLLSDASSYVNGAVVPVDGGLRLA